MRSKKSVSFDADGATYSICFSMNALVEFEKVSGLLAQDIATVFGSGNGGKVSFDRLRQVFWAGLTDVHDKITLRQAGQIMEEIGMAEVGRVVGEAMSKAFSDGKKSEVKSDPADALPVAAGNDQQAI